MMDTGQLLMKGRGVPGLTVPAVCILGDPSHHTQQKVKLRRPLGLLIVVIIIMRILTP